MEEKAYPEELSTLEPCQSDDLKNQLKIDEALEDTNTDLRNITLGQWNLTKEDHRYQISNRFAWSWKLARMGYPVVLVYLGILNAPYGRGSGKVFQSNFQASSKWEQKLFDHCNGIVDQNCWGDELYVGGTSFIPLCRSFDYSHLP